MQDLPASAQSSTSVTGCSMMLPYTHVHLSPPFTPDFRFTFTPPTPKSTASSAVHPSPTGSSYLTSGSSAFVLPQLSAIYPSPPPTSSTLSKRKISTDENTSPVSDDCSRQKRKRHTSGDKSHPLSVKERLSSVFEALQDVQWTLGDFLYFVFSSATENQEHLKRSHQHAAYVQHFLRGKSTHTPAEVIDAWFRSADGVLQPDSDERDLMFNTQKPFIEIRNVRAALSSFAAQKVHDKLLQEVKNVVKPENGLHTSALSQKGLEWKDIGSTTIEDVVSIMKKHQPLTWKYLTSIACRPPRKRNGTYNERQIRPVSGVCANVLGTLNFSYSENAQLLPMARGIYYFAHTVPYDIFAYQSRIGNTPSYSAVYERLKALSVQESSVARACGRDLSKMMLLVTDNVQNYHQVRDHRIGSTNSMIVGLAATAIELEDISPDAYDLAKKTELIQQNKRQHLTVEDLLGFIDYEHLDRVFALHWILVLTKYIPELTHLKSYVSKEFRTRVAKLRLPSRPSKIHPLATCGKNETVTTELKDALEDFMNQLGQTTSNFQERLTFVAGDGLTFEKIVHLKRYLHDHSDAFQRLDVLEPVLALWHTQWTDLSRLTETFWGATLSRDPSSLGHNATKISYKPPSNLKKVDFYPTSELIYTILEARILDCWRIHYGQDDIFAYFSTLAAKELLPSVEDLEKSAAQLHCGYSTTRAVHRAADNVLNSNSWSDGIPLGSTWDTSSASKDSADHAFGDHVLSNSIAFIRDALMSREFSYAIAEGDAGRAYEIMKVMLFTFAGSSHTKYVTYLLEMIATLELETTPASREAMLKSTLVNISGQAGSFCAVDFMQEHLNRLLEAVVQRKGAEYGATYIRDVIARNLHHFARIKTEFGREGVHLERRSGHHTAPHLKTEVQTLLREYKAHQLHYRRPGRKVDDLGEINDAFQKGIQYLWKGKLRTWIHDTTRIRMFATPPSNSVQATYNEESETSEDNTVSESPLSYESLSTFTPGSMYLIDGELIIDTDPKDSMDFCSTD